MTNEQIEQAAAEYSNERVEGTFKEQSLFENGFIAGAKWALSQTRWIPYPTQRPSEYGDYWVCRKDGKTHKETWNNTGWAYNDKVITHWMPLPEPPKQ